MPVGPLYASDQQLLNQNVSHMKGRDKDGINS